MMNNLHDDDHDDDHNQLIPPEFFELDASLEATSQYLQQQQQQHSMSSHVYVDQDLLQILQQLQDDVQIFQEKLKHHTTRIITSHAWNAIPEEMIVNILSYLDVRTLVEIKPVSQKWKRLSTTVIDAKGVGTTRKGFETNQELRTAVKRYCPLPEGKGGVACTDDLDNNDENAKQVYCHRDVAEEIACTYGWPIGKWDVSKMEDFSGVFYFETRYNEDIRKTECTNLILLFNEDISLWDVSKATTMKEMFCNAEYFNQNLSTWDVSNVRNMDSIFCDAKQFNSDLSIWDVSNVTNMGYMFSAAEQFNSDLSSWNTSNVTNMRGMFYEAEEFNQDLSSWNISNVTNMGSLFVGARHYAQWAQTWEDVWRAYLYPPESQFQFFPLIEDN